VNKWAEDREQKRRICPLCLLSIVPVYLPIGTVKGMLLASSTFDAPLPVSGDVVLPYMYVWAAITIPSVILGWLFVFPKAGQARWAAVVPGYNIYVLVVGVARLSTLWFILVLVPGVQIVAAILVNVEVARRFGRSEAFGLGLTLMGFIFYPLLGFSAAEYEANQKPLW
jgi:hypothetical protein